MLNELLEHHCDSDSIKKKIKFPSLDYDMVGICVSTKLIAGDKSDNVKGE